MEEQFPEVVGISHYEKLWTHLDKRELHDFGSTKLFFEHHFMNIRGTDVVPGAVVGNHCTRHGSSRCIMLLR